MSISQRLKIFFDSLNVEQQEFAANINISRQVVANALGGRTKYPKSDFLIKLLNTYPQLNLYWLLLGKGKMILTKKEMLINIDIEKKYLKTLEENTILKTKIITLLESQYSKEPILVH